MRICTLEVLICRLMSIDATLEIRQAWVSDGNAELAVDERRASGVPLKNGVVGPADPGSRTRTKKKTGRTREGPARQKQTSDRLEREVRHKLGGTGVVRKEPFVVAKSRVARLQESGTDIVGLDRGDIVQCPSHKLRVIEHIVRANADIKLDSLGKIESLPYLRID